ncbi:hypothetical protein A1Q2_08201 [Trichosporon asahii var. asahii CBS 8904]|uniref:Uncharacterized protein n=2 Tax=Trichosporon asahii var. asahii TaxID=189963 RepID=K1V0K0_TRIAC|nr:hypothetical protein A1Q1_01334 [Trichosporon asahii var. asahii CBS 2479]EJT52839.1 hypothetical protein A1Q1_01334 [Trichosporon asahii var. asahii CBS 2479]EKC97464.1 hypothetical protein A1Q2_08201 [Trichosporon asahii var. asahii CBS 8904]
MTSTTLIDHRSQPDEQEDEIALPKQQFDEQKNITEEQKVMINEQKDMINDRLFQQDRQAVTMHAEDLFRHPLLLAECTRTERKSCRLTQELIFVNMSVCQESVDVDLARAETAQILSRRWPVRTEVASVILVKGQFGEFKQRKILRDELGRAGGQDCESSRYG